MFMPLEQYLRDGHTNGIIDYSVRSRWEKDNRITFYIHPDGKPGDTQDYEVSCGNTLKHNRDIGHA